MTLPSTVMKQMDSIVYMCAKLIPHIRLEMLNVGLIYIDSQTDPLLDFSKCYINAPGTKHTIGLANF